MRLWDSLSPAERARALEEFTQSLGWKLVLEALQEQCAIRAAIILVEELTPDQIYRREFLRGERTGIELAYRTVETMAAEAMAEFEKEKVNGSARRPN